MKYRILEELRADFPGFVSGEGLSRILKVSRTAVWKCINELRKDGYVIESSSRKGYKLVSVPDTVNPFELRYGLKTSIIGRDIKFFNTVDSTNNCAKQAAGEGCPEGLVVVADRQTQGKGRMGRGWSSTGGKGVYFSIVLRPDIPPEEVQAITLAASVAVAAALRNTEGVDAGIKWPNDVVLENRKVCGILTEMNSEMERVNFIILGIGINVNQEADDFSGELKKKAVSLKQYAKEKGMLEKTFDRNAIIRDVLQELERLYLDICGGKNAGVIDEWKRYSLTIGREVRMSYKGCDYTGTAEDITADGKLVVKCSDGVVREVLSGEVSVRGLLGYV